MIHKTLIHIYAIYAGPTEMDEANLTYMSKLQTIQNLHHPERLYAVDFYNRVPPAKANRTGLRKHPYEKLHGDIPSLDELRPFGCWGLYSFR